MNDAKQAQKFCLKTSFALLLSDKPWISHEWLVISALRQGSVLCASVIFTVNHSTSIVQLFCRKQLPCNITLHVLNLWTSIKDYRTLGKFWKINEDFRQFFSQFLRQLLAAVIFTLRQEHKYFLQVLRDTHSSESQFDPSSSSSSSSSCDPSVTLNSSSDSLRVRSVTEVPLNERSVTEVTLTVMSPPLVDLTQRRKTGLRKTLYQRLPREPNVATSRHHTCDIPHPPKSVNSL